MVRIKKISKHQLPALVHLSYVGDNDLIEKYHPAKTDFNGSIQNTLDQIEETEKEYPLFYYKVIYDNKPIGYFVTGTGNVTDFLYSFCINIKYRKKDILIDWWTQVKKTMQRAFACYLYEYNFPAISFLEKNGMKILETKNSVVTLLNSV